MTVPGALAMNALYFRSFRRMILKFSLAARKMSEIHLPDTVEPHNVVLTTDGDMAGWNSRKGRVRDCTCGRGRLVSMMIMLLDGRKLGSLSLTSYFLLATSALSPSPWVLGFAGDGVGALFLRTNDGVFTIYPKSDRVVKLEELGTKKVHWH